MKIAVLGCGLRTPLLIHGLARSGLSVSQLELYDTDRAHAEIMTKLGQAVAEGSRMQVRSADTQLQAIDGCSFVISSIRVGSMEARAHDERLAMECGFAGQETTGPAGFAMALRTIPVAVDYARTVERAAPDAWMINFTNPAGLITQAISRHSRARVVGICDTPAELCFRIACGLGEPLENVRYDYVGLNHLGWITGVWVHQEDVTQRILNDDSLLESLYPSRLFPPELIRALQLIPTEYLFFYYSQRRALENQTRAGATRGEELLRLNQSVWSDLESGLQRGDVSSALKSYRSYLNRRNASYMRLESEAGSALGQDDPGWDPFAAATGYHRIAVDAIRALSSSEPSTMILNVPNGSAVDGLAPEDVVEIPCEVDSAGPRPLAIGPLPEPVRGLVLAIKTFERLTIRAAMERSASLGALALFANPLVGDWDRAADFFSRLMKNEPAASFPGVSLRNS